MTDSSPAIAPRIVLPPAVARIVRDRLPPVPNAPPQPPRAPSREPERFDLASLLRTCGLTFLLTWGLLQCRPLLGALAFPLGILVFGMGTIGLVLQIRWQSVSYDKRLRRRQAALESYFRLLASYSRKERDYQSAVAQARTPAAIAAYQRPLIQQALQQFDPLAATTRVTAPPSSLALAIARTLPPLPPPCLALDLALPTPDGDRRIDCAYLHAPLYVAIVTCDPNDALAARLPHTLAANGWIVLCIDRDVLEASPLVSCRAIAESLAECIARYAPPSDLAMAPEVGQLRPAGAEDAL